MRIAVIGAGGIGGYFGASLARAGHDVRFLARGEHRDAIRSRGLEVREPEGAWTVKVLATDEPAELIAGGSRDRRGQELLALRGGAGRAEARGGGRRRPAALERRRGVRVARPLGRSRRARILAGLAVISVERTAPGVITRKSDFRRVVVGERGGGGSERAERVAAVFGETGAEARVSADITVDLWRKFLFLTTLAAACGLARAPIGAGARPRRWDGGSWNARARDRRGRPGEGSRASRRRRRPGACEDDGPAGRDEAELPPGSRARRAQRARRPVRSGFPLREGERGRDAHPRRGRGGVLRRRWRRGCVQEGPAARKTVAGIRGESGATTRPSRGR